METCKYLQGCAFFNDPSVQRFQTLFDQLKADYCHGNFADCARYQVASRIGREHVPTSMLPTQLQWAEMILRRHSEESGGSGA
ncbi:MAG TPA: hypothetical protein PK054_09380 [Anaerohalosphaeraceae bacterium]|nr:hypothetical protein [Anaerohalosphaeraceae bacterium]HOL89334.1 hypothetical protein [Anaerohalosphaeraceae bacterium]HPP56773.1 hypothetical protein [Anaerohalosphaeraceae bacterium]